MITFFFPSSCIFFSPFLCRGVSNLSHLVHYYLPLVVVDDPLVLALHLRVCLFPFCFSSRTNFHLSCLASYQLPPIFSFACFSRYGCVCFPRFDCSSFFFFESSYCASRASFTVLRCFVLGFLFLFSCRRNLMGFIHTRSYTSIYIYTSNGSRHLLSDTKSCTSRQK